MIPVLDWTRFRADPQGFAADLGKAVRGAGFFLLEGHDLPERLVWQVFAQAEAFFALPERVKARLAITPANRGWAAEGSERLDPASGQIDRKEAFNIGLDLAADDPRVLAGEPFRAPNLWPQLPCFREILTEYFDAALAQGVALHRAFAMDLGLPERFFDDKFTAPMATLRLLSYPAATGAPGEIGAGAHTDYGALTLLLTDGAPGLQVRPRGQADWMDVPHREGALIVNIGDCLMRWTNDIYVSTPHRVLPPPRSRRSVAFFLDPDPEVLISALPGTGLPRHAPVRAARYLQERLAATYAGHGA